MRRRLKKVIRAIGYVLFFCGYFYILFINLGCAFLMDAESKADVIQALLVAAAIARLLPEIICWQHHYIEELERKIENM